MVWLCCAGLLVSSLVLYGSNSIRGTDQFWYLADVEAVIDGGPPVTNAYFPGTLLREALEPKGHNYFYHNGPMIYLSAFIGKYVGAYQGWILINLFCHFVVAIAVFIGARSLTTSSIASTISAFYLLSPLALWQTMSMLLEQYLAGIMAVVVIGFFYRRTWCGRFLFCCGVGLGVVSHPVFVAVGFMSGSVLLVGGYMRRCYPSIAAGLVAIVTVSYLGHAASDIYPNSFFPDIRTVIANVVPDKESMFWYFTDQPYSINRAMLIAKAHEAFSRQFVSTLQMPFNLFTNLAIVTWLWLFLVHRKQYHGCLLASGFVLALYIGQIFLMQHQVRYQQTIAPVVFVIIAVGLYKLPLLKKPAIVGIAFLWLILCGGFLANLSNNRAEQHAEVIAELSKTLDFIEPGSRIVALDCACDQRLNYVLKPRPILNIKSAYLQHQARSKAILMFKPDYLVSNNPFLDSVLFGLVPVKSSSDIVHGTLYWYRAGIPQSDDQLLLSSVDALQYWGVRANPFDN